MNDLRVLLLYAAPAEAATLSYQAGWPRHFVEHPRFDCTPVNVLTRGRLSGLTGLRGRWRGIDGVVLLHSVFSNEDFVDPALRRQLAKLSCPKAYFVGNEYKLLPEKMRLCEAIGVDLLVTMNPDERAQALYTQRLGCAVTCIPSAGLDPVRFRPELPPLERPVDLGYRAYDAPLYVGHVERRAIADAFLERGARLGLRLDISLDPGERFDERGWAAFLNRCRGQLGTEAGTDFFDLDDAMRRRVNAFLADNPHAQLPELWERFFMSVEDPVPARMISGRQVEAAATKTVQILYEGRYSDYLRPNEHYLPLRKDHSNLDEIVERFRDIDACRPIAEAAYEVALTELTYARLIDRFHDAFAALAGT